jgi:hypothetical protein
MADGTRRRTRAENDARILKTLEQVPNWLALRVLPKLSRTEDDCLVWSGGSTTKGYGLVALPTAIGGGKVTVHRVAYLKARGEIGDLDLDHLCRVRSCANVDHLRPATRQENLLAAGSQSLAATHAEKTYCPAGHELTEGNLRASGSRRGGRECHQCHLEKGRRRAAQVRDAHFALGLQKRSYIARFGQSARFACGVPQLAAYATALGVDTVDAIWVPA